MSNSPKSMRQCAANLNKVLVENKKGRIAITRQYLCQETGRSKIEGAFIDNFNDYCEQPDNDFQIALHRLPKKFFILFKTSPIFLPSDPGIDAGDDD